MHKVITSPKIIIDIRDPTTLITAIKSGFANEGVFLPMITVDEVSQTLLVSAV